jgi:hypothetical protein
VPDHPIFNTYKSTSKEVYLQNVIVATPAFDKEKNFEVNLKGIKYVDPVNGKPSFGVSRSLILRSNNTNLQNKVNPGNLGIKYEDEVIIMANTREFLGNMSKDLDKDLTIIIIPFILIQLACQDLYYINNIIKVWLKIMNNPYYFPPKIIRRSQNFPEINPYSVKFAYAMKKFTRHERIL